MSIKTFAPQAAPQVKALIYGATGNGKTRLAYSATQVPDLCPVLGINIGGNPMSVRDYDHSSLTIIEPETVADIDVLLNWLDAGQGKPAPFAPLAPYKTVVLDGLSDTQAMLEHMITGGAGKLTAPNTIDGYKQWGQMLQATILLARGLWAMPLHVIVTALEKYSELNGKYEPALYGQSANRIAHIPYIVGRITSIERADKAVRNAAKPDIERVLQVSATNQVPYAKWQYGKVAPYLPNPTMAQVWSLIAPQ